MMPFRESLASSKNAFSRISRHLSRPRLLLFAGTLIAFGLALGGLEKPNPDPSGEFTHLIDLSLPAHTPAQIQPIQETAQNVSPQAPWDNVDDESWELVTVRSGQSLDTIFRKQGVQRFTVAPDSGPQRRYPPIDENPAG
jgi:hypothetical protein